MISVATSIEEETHPEGTGSLTHNHEEMVSGSETDSNSDTESTPIIGDLPVQNLRRSSRTHKLPAILNEFVVDSKVKYEVERVVNYSSFTSDSFCFVSALNKSIEPRTYKEAIIDDNWVNAMNKEIEVLNKNHTWDITELPSGRKPIGCKWIYKIKYKANGEIERYKARLVAKGFNQRKGIDYDETFSHVVKMVTVRCLISLAVQNKWPLYQLDVNNVFLYGDLKEDVYMTIPQGFGNTGNKNLVCKLNKSLYGLKQASRKWNEKLVGILRENGFVQSCSDHSLFTKTVNNIFVALLVYVDDIVITGNDENEINKLLSKEMISIYLKENIVSNFYMSLVSLLVNLFLFLWRLACKPVSIRMEANTVLPFKPSHDNPYLDNITGYQKLVGKLICLTHTRPDISYLKGSPGKGLKFTHNMSSNMLEGYADSNWTKCPKTRKSVSGSFGSAACEIIWILKIMKDLKVEVNLPVSLFCDNKAALQLAVNPVFHERSHVAVNASLKDVLCK
ncbi:putative RNA-directed DNA polymerase [Tanacetum coccineum]